VRRRISKKKSKIWFKSKNLISIKNLISLIFFKSWFFQTLLTLLQRGCAPTRESLVCAETFLCLVNLVQVLSDLVTGQTIYSLAYLLVNLMDWFCCWISDAYFQWPETRLGPLEPKDRRFPLPGMVGSSIPQNVASSLSERVKIQRTPRYDADVLVAELPYERQSTAFEQFVAVSTEVWLLSCPI